MSALEDVIKSIVRELIQEEVSAAPHAPRPLLNAEEVGEMLGGLDKQVVYRLAREGALRPIYISQTSFRFQFEEVERFIREGGVKKPCLKEVPAPKVSRGGRR